MSFDAGRKTITPSSLSGSITIPPSKSLLHRGLFCAALAGDLSLCELPAELSDDIRATRDCLQKLLAGGSDFFCGESGTTLRLLIPVATARLERARFTGAGRLPQRPLAEYHDALSSHGVSFSNSPGGWKPSPPFLPLETRGRLTPGVFQLPGNVSSQYISGLLLALPMLASDSEILLTTNLESASYVDMTRDVMKRFGIKVGNSRETNRLCLTVEYHPRRPGRDTPYHIAKPYAAEPDFSQAAFWLLARFLGHDVIPANLPQSSSQSDAGFGSLVKSMERAAEVDGVPVVPRDIPAYGFTKAGIRAHRGSEGCHIDVSQIPDLFPALAAAASFAEGDTRLFNASRLRTKESDRIASTFDMLRAFGVEAAKDKGSLTVRGLAGKPYNSCVVDCCRDHRIVMAAAMLATRAKGPVTLVGADAVKKSYPTFFDHFKHAGGVCS
ncbi:MAG: 3-phosphoshikimate 1-carboxyvinyltransferase [Kiritimatiellaeota bacterium]|nr:3-phosphoshikimate 1-carboxyvinyltransferase [Kiritimatiellota bacterium]